MTDHRWLSFPAILSSRSFLLLFYSSLVSHRPHIIPCNIAMLCSMIVSSTESVAHWCSCVFHIYIMVGYQLKSVQPEIFSVKVTIFVPFLGFNPCHSYNWLFFVAIPVRSCLLQLHCSSWMLNDCISLHSNLFFFPIFSRELPLWLNYFSSMSNCTSK